jgi:single-strand DNA-binding protein
MKDLNRLTLTGHVGADPEIRHADNGTVVTKFTVASNRRWTDQQGAAQEETEWFNIVCFSRLAEIAGDYLNKGSHVLIDGRLHTRAYEDNSGQKRSWTEVIAADLILLDRRADAAAADVDDAPAQATERPTARQPERRHARQRPRAADVL